MRLDDEEAWSRFAGARSATLVTLGPDALPSPVPIVFAAIDDDRVITAVDHKPKSTRDLARLRHIATDPRVTVLAQHYSETWDDLWWVRATGRAAVSSERPPEAVALEAKYQQYASDPPEGPWIIVEVDRLTGWSAR